MVRLVFGRKRHLMSTLRPLKVAVFLDQTIRAGGGYQQSINAALLVKKIPIDLVEPIFFTNHRTNIPILKHYGIDAVFVPLPLIRRVFLKVRSLITNSMALNLWKKVMGLNGFERCFIEHGVDLVYFTSPTVLACRLESLNYITTVWDLCHRDDVEFPEVRVDRAFEARERHYLKVLPKAIAILVESPLGKMNVVRRYGIDELRVHVMRLTPALGTQVSEETYQANYINILQKYQLNIPYVYYPAQFWSHKNHVYLLEGLKCLEEKFGKEVGAIFSGGDQGNLTYVQEVAERLGLLERVRFAGFVPNEEIPYLYKQSLALVMPTYFGPTNLPPLEAFSLDVPVLYPDKVGLRDQVGNAALLMDLCEPMTMATHLAELIENPALRESLVKNGRDVMTKYTDDSRLDVLKMVLYDFRRRRVCWR